MAVREATEADLPALTAIYNDIIATTTAVYSDEPVAIENRRAWWADRIGDGYPVLVATDADEVVGFASFGDFRGWPGYRYTVEHSVHVRRDRREKGIGRQLLSALLPRAAALGKHAIIGGVDAENAASIRLHEALGFQQVGHFRQVGWKFGRWLDLVFLERLLDVNGVPRA